MNDFKIKRSWLRPTGKSEVDVTMSRLALVVSDRIVTSYTSEFEPSDDHLEIPAYFLAEWIAENWWLLLWEPRKNDDDGGDSADFLSRHSILTAQHGYALPKLSFVPIGKKLHISAVAREVSLAEIRFRNTATALTTRGEVENELKKFVTSVVEKLSQSAISDTALQNAWQLIAETSADEVEFCRYMGMVGLSPYVGNEGIEAGLSRLLPILGSRLITDLCMAATSENFVAMAAAAEAAHGSLQTAAPACLEPLSKLSVPSENEELPAWRCGVQAAKKVRTYLGIKETDPSGASTFFQKLNIDPKVQSDNHFASSPLVGAVRRDHQDIRIALLQNAETQRRFSAARAAYAAWTAEKESEARFLTLAVTRDQQASRAFAAEMTAPLAFIRSHTKGNKLSQDRMYDIAADLNIGADVVQKQATNNGIQVARVY